MRSFDDSGLKNCPQCDSKLVSVKFKSGTEGRRAQELSDSGIRWRYEADVFDWQPPMRKYKPDFTVYNADGTPVYYEEVKGWLKPDDIIKMVAVKQQHPDADIRMVFENPNSTLRKRKDGTKFTYSDWAKQYDYPFSKVR